MSWGGKRRAEKKEGARALVWIDVWAWADVPAAGRPVDGARLGCPGAAARGAIQPPTLASAAWHQVPPPSSSPSRAAVGLCQSGAGARVWGPHPDVPLLGCDTQGRPLRLFGSWCPTSAKWGCWGRKAILAFWKRWCVFPSPTSVLSLGQRGDSQWTESPALLRSESAQGQLSKAGLFSI